MRQFSMRLTDEEWKKLAYAAIEGCTSQKEIILIALDEYLNKRKKNENDHIRNT